MKKTLLALMISCVAFASQASYLMWQVDSNTIDVGSDTLTYDNANVIAIRASDGATFTLSSVDLNGVDMGTDIQAPMGTALYANLSVLEETLDGYSYYIELSNYVSSPTPSRTFVAKSENKSYEALSASITTALPTAASAASVSVWHGSSYTAVPEPTSAILMLFGAAMLGLKRKQRRLA